MVEQALSLGFTKSDCLICKNNKHYEYGDWIIYEGCFGVYFLKHICGLILPLKDKEHFKRVFEDVIERVHPLTPSEIEVYESTEEIISKLI